LLERRCMQWAALPKKLVMEWPRSTSMVPRRRLHLWATRVCGLSRMSPVEVA